MIPHPALQPISEGTATFKEAAGICEAALARADPQELDHLLLAFEAWTWKALHARRTDDGVPEWRDLILGVEARLSLSEGTGTIRTRLHQLARLLSISVHVGSCVRDGRYVWAVHEPFGRLPAMLHWKHRLKAVAVLGTLEAVTRLHEAAAARRSWLPEEFSDLVAAAFRPEALKVRDLTDALGLSFTTVARWRDAKACPHPEMRDRVVAWTLEALGSRAASLRRELEGLTRD